MALPRIVAGRLLLAAAFGAAIALALVLRLRQAAVPLSFDEFASLYFADRPFSDLWGWWMLRETNPPLFYSVLKLWRLALPETQPALRLLPLLLSLAQIALVARFAARTYGALAAVLCVVLFALSPSDIFQSEYIRGYVLTKLAVTVSFIGLAAALGSGSTRSARLGWAAYLGGAVVAAYSHTTMLLWPAIATAAALAEAALSRRPGRARLARLILADLAIAALSAPVLGFAIIQMRTRAGNIAWIQPLSLDGYRDNMRLQLLMDGALASWLMLALILVGIVRTFRNPVTRLSLFIVVATLAAFKAADLVHPILSDHTLHWCATFTVLLAAAALAEPAPAGRRLAAFRIAGAAAIGAVALAGYDQLHHQHVRIPRLQDWQYTVATVARTPGAALLVSHESIGVIVEQACTLQLRAPRCPFPLVVMASSAPSDSWAAGGYHGTLVEPDKVPEALRGAREVYAFQRYVYRPLEPLGIDGSRYRQVEWDDGKLIGPIPASAFTEVHRDFPGRQVIPPDLKPL